MNADLWQDVKTVLDAVWERPEPERQAILAETMLRDPILAQEVKTLLGVRAPNEIIVPGHGLPGDLDYVTDQLRTFRKKAS